MTEFPRNCDHTIDNVEFVLLILPFPLEQDIKMPILKGNESNMVLGHYILEAINPATRFRLA
jgi:hypothetical protein